MKKRKRGFTIVELVVVVLIIGVLALMALPVFQNVTEDAKTKTFQNNARVLISAIGMYQSENAGNYPTQMSDVDMYVNGGTDSITGGTSGEATPKGATYVIGADGSMTAKFTPKGGTEIEIKYPDIVTNP